MTATATVDITVTGVGGVEINMNWLQPPASEIRLVLAADGGDDTGRRGRRIEHAVGFEGLVEIVVDHTRFHPAVAVLRIDFQDAVHTGYIHHNALTHHLSGQGSTGGSGARWCAG